MKYEKIDGNERVWVVKRGPDGKLTEQLDPKLFAALHPELSKKSWPTRSRSPPAPPKSQTRGPGKLEAPERSEPGAKRRASSA